MKIYDVTIKLTLVDMAKRLDTRDVAVHVQRSASQLLADLAGSKSNFAATIEYTEVVDRDSLPRPA